MKRSRLTLQKMINDDNDIEWDPVAAADKIMNTM
jgi:hypothetical protein